MFWLDLVSASADTSKKIERMKEEAKIAKFSLLMSSKQHRNLKRSGIIRNQGKELGIDMTGSTILSFGFTHTSYDEYMGTVNSSGQPHGRGAKWYCTYILLYLYFTVYYCTYILLKVFRWKHLCW